ncbi:MAG: apolipoprotein N-acyltransferase [Stellaceae bacterium]
MVEAARLFRIHPGARVETPLCRLAQHLGGMVGGRRYGLAFLLGVSAAGALPPVDLTPLVAVAFPGLLWLDEGSAGPWASFALGWSFGLGFFLAGLYWVAAALFVDLRAFWWLVPIAALGLPAVLALYSGAALGATALLARHLRLPPTARVCAFAICWTAAGWVRGHAFTGFPWNLIGYAWSGAFPGALAMLQSVSWIGIYGLSLITVLAASLLALLGTPLLAPVTPGRRRGPIIAVVLLILVPSAAGAVRLARSAPADTGIWLRLVQPSIPQSLKWNPAAAQRNFDRLLVLSREPVTHRLAAVLWPEAAVPFLIGRDAPARRAIAAVAPKGGYLITGALRANPPPGPVTRLWNSIEAVNRQGKIVARYDKTHLVPFGEYVPAWVRDILPIKKITAGMIDLSAGPGPQTITLPDLPAFSPVVCYEVIFPGEVVDESRRPAWILNVTDDAWYGRTSGPYQHFAIARTRAVEEGLPLIRVANNGISGVVDAEGRVVTQLGLDDIGYADVVLPVAGARTLYATEGDLPLLVLLVLTAVPVALRLR